MEKIYNRDWKLFEGEILDEETLQKLPECLEKDHLIEISKMLTKEWLNPKAFYVCEYPIEGVYYIQSGKQGVNYFGVHYDSEKEKLSPFYVENNYVKNCLTIKQSIFKFKEEL